MTMTNKVSYVVNVTHMTCDKMNYKDCEDMGKDKEKEIDKDTNIDNDKDELIQSCGKCNTYVMVKEEIQGRKRNGLREIGRDKKKGKKTTAKVLAKRQRKTKAKTNTQTQ